MKNITKNLFYLFVILISLGACQSARDALEGKKKGGGDEFLVLKKNPLVLPPEFDELPEPTTSTSEDKNKEEEIDLQIIFGKSSGSISTNSKIKTTNGPLEKSIMEKIKNN
jgi:hypothetical protein